MLFMDTIPELNATDISIYKFVVAHIDEIPFMSVRELAEQSHTSTASVHRFCKKFDCDGFSEFKVRIRLYNNESKDQKLGATDVSMLMEFLRRTTAQQFIDSINKAANIIKDKELLIFIGEGPSGNIAEYGAHYFSLFFGMTAYISSVNNHYIHHISEDLSKKTGMIVMSVSGETDNMIHYMQSQPYNNCSVISITNDPMSTISKLSDANISYFINQDMIPGHDRTSQVPALYTLEVLAKRVKELMPVDH